MRRRRAMTLIEVLLALVLLLGMLAVVLTLHDFADDYRRSIVASARGVSARRGVMRRITGDLRAAMVYPLPGFDEETGEVTHVDSGLVGEFDSARFVTARLPGAAAWAVQQIGDEPIPPEPDVELIEWSLRYDQETGDVLGLQRTTRRVVGWAAREETGRSVLVSSDVRMLYVRYFDGSEWVEYWEGRDLPVAVDVWLAAEPLPEELAQSGDIFEYVAALPDVQRRIIYVPGGTKAMATTFAPTGSAPGGASVGRGRVGGGSIGGGSVGGPRSGGGGR